MSPETELRTPFEVNQAGLRIRGETVGADRPIVLLHGITAGRNYVVHGSRHLPREGFETILYDARGHGESDPAPAGAYTYDALAADLLGVLDVTDRGERPVLAGHSMGAHTVMRVALAHPERFAGIVVIGPSYTDTTPEPDAIRQWDELADGLESAGIEGFLAAYERGGLDPDWRDTLLRITRERLEIHRHPDAVAQAIREVPRSAPFGSLDDLELLELPALVVGSHDRADPGHPLSVAEAYAERLPNARLISEGEGESPLAWQGGRLSRAIAEFCGEPQVTKRR